jgi:hypothetical protein
MSGLGRFRFRSPERDRESDERRLGLIRMVARSAIADAEAEATGLRARIAEARRSAIFLVQQVDAGVPRPEFSNSAKQLLAIEQRLAQLEDHLTALGKLERRLHRLIDQPRVSALGPPSSGPAR